MWEPLKIRPSRMIYGKSLEELPLYKTRSFLDHLHPVLESGKGYVVYFPQSNSVRKAHDLSIPWLENPINFQSHQRWNPRHVRASATSSPPTLPTTCPNEIRRKRGRERDLQGFGVQLTFLAHLAVHCRVGLRRGEFYLDVGGSEAERRAGVVVTQVTGH